MPQTQLKTSPLMFSLLAIALESNGICPSASAAPIRLADLDRSRVEYALGAVKEIQKEWPVRTPDSCILLFGAQAEWLMNCTDPGHGWAAAGSQTLNGMPVFYSSQPVSLAHQRMPYVQVKQALVAQAFFYLASGPSTKVYKDRPWFAISRLEDLAKNHPAFGSGTSTEEWLSIFVHEYFHITQLTEPHAVEFMTAKSSQAAFVPQAVLTEFYAENPEYRLALKEEHDLLSNALSAAPPLDKERARRTLSQWAKLYQRRVKRFSKAFEKGDPRRNLELWDAYWTYIEGLARYAESKVLIDARHHPKTGIPNDPRFSGVDSPEGKGYPGLPVPNKRMGKSYYYSIGMHLAFVLDTADPGWKRRLFSNRLWLAGAAIDSSTPTPTP